MNSWNSDVGRPVFAAKSKLNLNVGSFVWNVVNICTFILLAVLHYLLRLETWFKYIFVSIFLGKQNVLIVLFYWSFWLFHVHLSYSYNMSFYSLLYASCLLDFLRNVLLGSLMLSVNASDGHFDWMNGLFRYLYIPTCFQLIESCTSISLFFLVIYVLIVLNCAVTFWKWCCWQILLCFRCWMICDKSLTENIYRYLSFWL